MLKLEAVCKQMTFGVISAIAKYGFMLRADYT
jgi:hypothetical protein